MLYWDNTKYTTYIKWQNCFIYSIFNVMSWKNVVQLYLYMDVILQQMYFKNKSKYFQNAIVQLFFNG